MGEFLKPARPGDEPLDHYTAAAFNEFAATANARKLPLSQRDASPLDYTTNPNVFWVKNNSGGARERYDVLAMTGVLWTPTTNLASFQAGPVLLGTLPTLADSGNFAMLLEPVATSKFSRALFSGVVTKIQVDHVQHPYADVAASTARLTSNWYGGAKIVYKESGTGVKWAIVRMLNDMFRGPILCKATSGITAGSSANCAVYVASVAASPAATITVHLKDMDGGNDLAADKFLWAWWKPDDQRFETGNAEC